MEKQNKAKTATMTSLMNHTQPDWSNSEVSKLNKYKNLLFEFQQRQIISKIMSREDNKMEFYQILSKDQLPKNLQKNNFQSLNTKQNISSLIKVHKKQNMTSKESMIRRALRENGEIMLLSQIYNHLDDPLEPVKLNQQKLRCEATPLSNVINQLDEWEKLTSKKGTLQARFSKLRLPNMTPQQRRSSHHKKSFVVKKFKIGSDYKSEIEKSLQVINCSHKNEQNLMVKFGLIQNSSKMLKKQLEQMKQLVETQIQQKMKKLSQSRKEHHRLYQQKLKLQIEQQELDQEMAREQGGLAQNTGYGFHSMNQSNIKIVFEDKKNQIEKNDAKIMKIKKNIEFLEQEALKNEEELKNIVLAESTYYKISLKNGIDCRDTGLVWVIKKLGDQQTDLNQLQFPNYLDKKSRTYLITKAKNQEKLWNILSEKKLFVQEIGRESEDYKTVKRSNSRLPSRKSSIKLEKPIQIRPQQSDGIREIINQCDSSDIPKRYSRSVKKITALREQYLKNQNLFKLSQARRGLKFGNDLTGMTGRQIYNSIGQKIKQIDFTRLRKQISQGKSDKIFEYQAILRKIEEMHMEIEQQDIQHESHLLSQYKDQKQLFFILAAACFGVKRAYSLIIKNFSWKNTI